VPSISPFELPSNTDIKIHLRDATVQEAIDLSEISPLHEEAATTEFLNKVQIPEHYKDSSKWTGQDRKFALFWYHLHTVEKSRYSTSYSDCPECGGRHSVSFDLRELANEYKQLEGKPFREIDFQNELVSVAPPNGEVLTKLEELRLDLDGASDGEKRKLEAEIRFLSVALCIDFIGDAEGEEADRERRKIQRLRSLPLNTFKDLSLKVAMAQMSMDHGLKSEIVDGELQLILPMQHCPTNKGGEGIVLRSPFRNHHHIPRL